jgi:hypothetical protein
MWKFSTTTYPTSNKDYHCDASEYVNNMLGYFELTEEDSVIFDKAMEEKLKILKCTKYLKTEGKYDGEFCTFRARLDMHELCLKYELYPYD